jgi:hypothetical protein
MEDITKLTASLIEEALRKQSAKFEEKWKQ